MPGSRLREGVIRRESHFATTYSGKNKIVGYVANGLIDSSDNFTPPCQYAKDPLKY